MIETETTKGVPQPRCVAAPTTPNLTRPVRTQPIPTEPNRTITFFRSRVATEATRRIILTNLTNFDLCLRKSSDQNGVKRTSNSTDLETSRPNSTYLGHHFSRVSDDSAWSAAYFRGLCSVPLRTSRPLREIRSFELGTWSLKLHSTPPSAAFRSLPPGLFTPSAGFSGCRCSPRHQTPAVTCGHLRKHFPVFSFFSPCKPGHVQTPFNPQPNGS